MGADSTQLVSAPLQIAAIGVNDLPHVWDQVEPLIERACSYSYGRLTPQSILAGLGLYDGLVRFNMLALVDGEAITAIMVTCVQIAPSGKRTMEIIAVSGVEFDKWLPFEPQMDEFARAQGCSSVLIPQGRKGWLKKLPHWKERGVILEREL